MEDNNVESIVNKPGVQKLELPEAAGGAMMSILSAVHMASSRVTQARDDERMSQEDLDKMEKILEVSLKNTAGFLRLNLDGIIYSLMGDGESGDFPPMFSEKSKILCKVIHSDFSTILTLMSHMNKALEEIQEENAKVIKRFREGKDVRGMTVEENGPLDKEIPDNVVKFPTGTIH